MKATVAAILPFALFGSLLAAPESPLQVEIREPNFPRTGDPQFTRLALSARFTNNSSEPIRIILPLDGSLDGHFAPHYRVTVSNKTGAIKLRGRVCAAYGLWSNIVKWPDDYVILIPPRHSHEVPLDVPIDMRALGQYRIVFEYEMPAQIPQPQIPQDAILLPGPRLTYPDNVWRGTAHAKEITIDRTEAAK